MTRNIDRLIEVMARLRNPDGGCPWDLEQTYRSIAPHTIEEAYEVADAIEKDDKAALREELGDLLFQVVYYSQMAHEEGLFDFDEVAGVITDKMIRRHPPRLRTGRGEDRRPSDLALGRPQGGRACGQGGRGGAGAVGAGGCHRRIAGADPGAEAAEPRRAGRLRLDRRPRQSSTRSRRRCGNCGRKWTPDRRRSGSRTRWATCCSPWSTSPAG